MGRGARIMNQKEMVSAITKALQTDHAERFKRAYKTEEEVTLFKKRLWMGTKGIEPRIAIQAYEQVIKEKPSYMPTLPEIVSSARTLSNRTKNNEAERMQHEQQAALPPPTHHVNAIEELAKAQLTESTHTLAELAKSLEQLVARDKQRGKIRTSPRTVNWKCAVGHCRKAGGFTNSLKGSDTWYCKEHHQSI